ncbi:MAG: ribosome recycling factor [Sulfuricurvum sp. PC08-66]|nr:MAG: ribosome recycling factor [Sulfuricurvum sp. PC08-66]
MLQPIYDETKLKMNESIDAMRRDFLTLRTGRVTTSILDNVKVDYYGTMTPLSQVASVLATDATTITVSPWEKNLLSAIEKAIQIANIGVNPNNDGTIIKLFFPPMTVEQRHESVKHSKAMGEKAKVAVRNTRKNSNDKIKKLEKDKLITADESKTAQDMVQKITDTTINTIDSVLKEKEAEILKV